MPPVPPAGALVGRNSELTMLAGLVKSAADSRGGSVIIEGEPGIGKSALVRAATAMAAEAGCQVFWGAGDELGQALPLLPFQDGLRLREPSANPRRTAILQLLRGEVIPDHMDVPAVLTEQLLSLVAEQCAMRPAILVIDDLQWADPASITVWGRLARTAPQMPLLLIGMMRPVPQRDDVLALRRAAVGATRLRLGELAEEAVADLVAALAGGKPDDNLLRRADDAAGNPLYLTELVGALNRSSSLTITEAGTVELTGESAPDSLSAAIADRLDFLTRPVRDVLRAATLLGADFAVTDLATVLNRSVTDLIPAIDEAQAADVLAEAANGLEFRHPLIRAALYNEMSASVRAAWHGEAGRALAAANAPADRVAGQILLAVGAPGGTAEPVEEWMLDWLARTADQLVSQAPQVAADLLRRAVASTPADSARHGQLAGRLADALYRIGDRDEAERVAKNALEHLEDDADLDLLVDLHCLLAQCRIKSTESLATLDRALATPGISARHRARLLIPAARTYGHLGDLEKADQVAADALAAASEAGDPWAMGWTFFVMALVSSMRGRMADALSLYDQALTAIQTDPVLTDLRLLLQVNKAITLGNLDRYEDALAAARQARHDADQVGTTFRLSQAHSALAQLLFQAGRWDDALDEIEFAAEGLKEPAMVYCDRGIAATISFHRGDIGKARQHLDAITPYGERLPARPIAPLVLARSLDREQDGALPEALAELTDTINGNPDEIDEIEILLADAVRLAAAIGDLGTGQALAELADTLAAGSQVPHRQANALHCHGLLDRDASRLLAAAQRWDDAGRPLPRAKALEAAAGQFVVAGDTGQARAAFTRAAEVYESLGAAADVRRLQAIFRGHGIRRGPSQPHRRARSGWDSLTPAEITVAGFVEEGLSNPEIAARLQVSPRTVATHVSNILKKLDVRTRADITRESVLRTIPRQR